jgi:hypothetical protein
MRNAIPNRSPPRKSSEQYVPTEKPYRHVWDHGFAIRLEGGRKRRERFLCPTILNCLVSLVPVSCVPAQIYIERESPFFIYTDRDTGHGDKRDTIKLWGGLQRPRWRHDHQPLHHQLRNMFQDSRAQREC